MFNLIHTVWQQAIAALSHQRCSIGASLFRIGAGLTILYQYVIVYHQRSFFYGPDGVVPYTWFVQHLRDTRSFSLYALDPAPQVFEAVFHLGIAITALWVLGWHTRAMTLLTWIFLWSIHHRNPALWDGGDNLVQIVLIYAIFADLGAACSVDAGLRRPQDGSHALVQQVQALFHNAAVLAVGCQLCLVYSAAGLAKVQGALWQNGTALYYILRAGEFAWTGYGTSITEQSILVTLLTYGTVVFQVCFPFLFAMHPLTRRLALVIGISFHLGIGLVMGLMTFSAFLISIELMLIPDRDYHAARAACRQLWQRAAASGKAVFSSRGRGGQRSGGGDTTS